MSSREKFRMTLQRRAILEELKKVTSHPTADEVYRIVRRRLPRISLGTVYRNLEVLSERGMIQKLELGGAQRQFDGNAHHHYHVRCIGCRSVRDVHLDPATALEGTVGRFTDYKILGHRLEFIGLCPACRARERRGHARGLRNA